MKITMKGDTAEVLIYGEIGDTFFGDGINAKDFRQQIKATKASVINVRINSPGGNVFDASSMKNALDEHKARIEVDIDGLAASAASVVAMSGDVVRVAQNGLMMIHDPSSGVMGGAAEMRRTADLLDKVRQQIIDTYGKKIGDKATKEQIAAWMAAETWFTGQEAVDAGLADEVSGAIKMAACANLDKRNFKNAPESLFKSGPTAEEIAEYNRMKEQAAKLCAK